MLAERATRDELMDADDLAPEVYTAVMHDLAKVNTLTLARRPTLRFIDRVARRHAAGGEALRVLDVGYGDGDMLRAIAKWAMRIGFDVTLAGIDLNPRSAAAASNTASAIAIDYRTGDYTALAGEQWDVILSSLVAHHMTHVQLIGFLRFMEAEARAGWFVNDLHRHGFAYRGFPLLARLMRWHPIVRHDGQLSIARSYRPREWVPILKEAGITGATVSRAFPFRLCVAKIR